MATRRPTFIPQDLAPRRAAGISSTTRTYGKPDVGIPERFDVLRFVSAPAVEAIRRSFLLNKASHDGWASFRREGRFDPRQAARATRLERDVFKRRTGKSVTRVRLVVLLDASGSMATQDARFPNPNNPAQMLVGTRRHASAIFGATVAKALGSVPSVDLDVFQHTIGSQMILKYRWAKGTPLAVFNAAAESIGASGNADGHAIFALTQRMLKDLKRDERGVIMVVSDGLPTDYGTGGKDDARQALRDSIAYARKHGITVLGVAIDGSDQSAYWGKDGTISHDGSWTHLGSALAKVVGKALAIR